MSGIDRHPHESHKSKPSFAIDALHTGKYDAVVERLLAEGMEEQKTTNPLLVALESQDNGEIGPGGFTEKEATEQLDRFFAQFDDEYMKRSGVFTYLDNFTVVYSPEQQSYKIVDQPIRPITRLDLEWASMEDLYVPLALLDLKDFTCNNGKFKQISELPATLEVFDCSNGKLEGLPNLPPGLTTLRCSSNKLIELPELPSTLVSLQCSSNQLTKLPQLPAKLCTLACRENKLTKLPALPPGLYTLRCGYNQLESLPVLPNNLGELYCSSNKLSELPDLPNSLVELVCSANALRSLPPLKDTSLTGLTCSDNQLKSLPDLPTSLTYLACNDNQIKNVPQIPMSVLSGSFLGNPLSWRAKRIMKKRKLFH